MTSVQLMLKTDYAKTSYGETAYDRTERLQYRCYDTVAHDSLYYMIPISKSYHTPGLSSVGHFEDDCATT